MKKQEVCRYDHDTPEYVVLHGQWARSRGRNPSTEFLGEKNPRRALALAARLAHFPKSGSYLDGAVPENYVCAQCGATGCKLWREYQAWNPRLLCAVCAAADQKKDIGDLNESGLRMINNRSTDTIGWFVPAVPTEDGTTHCTCWGYLSVPTSGCKWWEQLPTFPKKPPALA
jgi:hypothetical protein